MTANRQAKRAARQLFRLCLADGALDDARVRQVAPRLAASKRRGAVAVLSGFRRLVKLECERRSAIVESASPLPPDLRNRIRADLVRIYGAGLKTSFTQNPALIGGVRIKVGSDVYDGSVRARLAALAARL
jgi:F-type H+-transporting ATPase subunit delta